MAAKIHGRLAAVAFQTDATGAGGTATIYTVPAGRKATVTLNVANRNVSAAFLAALYFLANGESTTTAANTLEVNSNIPAGTQLERTGITMQAGSSLRVAIAGNSMTATAMVWGIEEDV